MPYLNKTTPRDADMPAVCRKGYELFENFYTRTVALRQRCRENEMLYRGDHWYNRPQTDPGDPQPVTPLLFSTLENTLSDLMDYYPQPVILGEEPSDDALAQDLTLLMQYVLHQRHYRKIYRDKCRQALKFGTSIQEVFWDHALLNGLGDVNVKPLDLRNFLFDPDCAHVQDGRACFKFGFYPRPYVLQRYGAAAQDMQRGVLQAIQDDARYASAPHAALLTDDDTVLMLEYYYKTMDAQTGRTQVNMARLAGGKVLEHFEDMYRHGQYPFIVEPLYRLEGEVAGMGLIDIFKDLQQYTNKLDQIIMRNALISGKVKLLVNKSAGLNDTALHDWDSEVVEGMRIDEGALRWFQPQPLPGYMLDYMNRKIDLLKTESGQSEWLRGETARGVTAASAIIALQEAGSKRSRMLVDALYDGYEDLLRMMIALIAQNYTEQRTLRIRGRQDRVIRMDGQSLCRKTQSGQPGACLDFDIRVTAHKTPPSEALYNNELALKLMELGVLQPKEALGMMDFAAKERVLEQLQRRVTAPQADARAE